MRQSVNELLRLQVRPMARRDAGIGQRFRPFVARGLPAVLATRMSAKGRVRILCMHQE